MGVGGKDGWVWVGFSKGGCVAVEEEIGRCGQSMNHYRNYCTAYCTILCTDKCMTFVYN